MKDFLTVAELIEYLRQFPQDLKVAAYYQLNDWPGDAWQFFQANAEVKKPIELTKTGSADERCQEQALIFSV